MVVPQRPRFRGRISYAPNFSGVGLPVPNARIRLYDKDTSGNDLLIDTTTNSQGYFNKRGTRDWQDMTVIDVPFVGRRRVPDVTDVPVFLIRIDDPATGQSITAPFGYLGDAIDVPVIVPWTGPQENLLKINQESIYPNTPPDRVWDTIKDLCEAGQNVTITFPGMRNVPIELPFNNGQLDLDSFRVLVCELLGIDPNSNVLRVNPEPAVITATALIVFIIVVASPLALAAAAFLVILGIAILLAVALGYSVDVEYEGGASSSPNTPTASIPLWNVKVKLIPPSN